MLGRAPGTPGRQRLSYALTQAQSPNPAPVAGRVKRTSYVVPGSLAVEAISGVTGHHTSCERRSRPTTTGATFGS